MWSTGGIGSLSIVAVGERPDLELVGVWVHSDGKVGKDSGELANGTPNGVPATDDVEALLALAPDCVIYAASGPERDAGAVPDYERLLAAGINVVTTTSTNLINPRSYVPSHRERLESAARAGGASIYASGIEPGFVCDQLPLVLSTASRSVSEVHCYETALYDDYGVEEIMINALGFGQPMEFEPWINLPGAIAGEFQGQVGLIADGLGVEVEDVRETYDRRLTEKPIETAFGNRRARHLRCHPVPGDRCRRRARGDRHRPHQAARPPRRSRLAARRGRPVLPGRARGQAEPRLLGHPHAR